MRRERVVGIVLALVTVIVVTINQRDVGIARDEVVYMQHGSKYADWWTGLVTFSHGAGKDSITRTFGGKGATDNNREHPPLMKTLFGLSEKLLHDKLDELLALGRWSQRASDALDRIRGQQLLDNIGASRRRAKPKLLHSG